MSTQAEQVRAFGVNLRIDIVKCHNSLGNQLGQKVLARYLHEIASNGLEIHGRAATVAMFQAQLYALNAGSDEPPAIVEPEPTVIDLAEVPEPEPEIVIEAKRGWRDWVPDASVLYFLGGILTGVIASAPYL